VAEVAEHITLARIGNFRVFKQVKTSPAAPDKREQVKAKDEIDFAESADRSHKAQAPEFLLSPPAAGPRRRT